MQINFLVFDTAPYTFNKHVVAPTTFPIHADLDVAVQQFLGESFAGELAALIGVEYLGLSITSVGFFIARRHRNPFPW